MGRMGPTVTVRAAALVALATALIGLLIVRELRGPRRLVMTRTVIVLLFGAVAVVGVSYVQHGVEGVSSGLSTASDWLSVLSAVFAFVLGFGTQGLARISGRPSIAVAIPSRAAFFRDVRRGLMATLSFMRHDSTDEYISTLSAREDLASFHECLRRALDARPDFLVIGPPSQHALEDEGVTRSLHGFLARGGVLFCIEHRPVAPSRTRDARRMVDVRSDSAAGAVVLSSYLSTRLAPDAHVLLIAGPAFSEPARIRREILCGAWPEADVRVLDVPGWTPTAARRVASIALDRDADVDLIVCGNDEMALEVCELVQARQLSTQVAGYDGLIRALFCICEPANPFVATVRIPPRAYGERIGRAICDLCRVSALVFRRRLDCDMKIGISDVNLVTLDNVKDLIEAMD